MRLEFELFMNLTKQEFICTYEKLQISGTEYGCSSFTLALCKEDIFTALLHMNAAFWEKLPIVLHVLLAFPPKTYERTT